MQQGNALQKITTPNLDESRTIYCICNHSCSSPEWKLLSDEEKRSLGLTFDHDGEFWYVVK